MSVFQRILGTTAFIVLLFVAEQRPIFSKMPPQSVERIELTKRDLFEFKHWDSTRIDVLGFHLGMTRHEANLNASRNGFRLAIFDLRGSETCSGDKCEVCDAKAVCPGIVLDFAGEQVVGLRIIRIAEYADPEVRRAAITNRFKGQTKLLFDNYSNGLRMKLFGTEDRREGPSDKNPLSQSDVTYKYLSLGVNVFVEPNPHGPESTSDLTIAFVAPAAQPRN